MIIRFCRLLWAARFSPIFTPSLVQTRRLSGGVLFLGSFAFQSQPPWGFFFIAWNSISFLGPASASVPFLINTLPINLYFHHTVLIFHTVGLCLRTERMLLIKDKRLAAMLIFFALCERAAFVRVSVNLLCTDGDGRFACTCHKKIKLHHYRN